MKVHADPDNLEKVKRRVEQAKIKFLEGCEPREGKKLLVLDIDYTLFDHRSPAERPEELRRPFLIEFLSRSYEHYDIVIWSATSMKWIELKMKELGVMHHVQQNAFKILAFVDYTAMIPVTTEKYGTIDCKPLGVLWQHPGFKGNYGKENTIMFDDLRRNFVMNPRNGLKIRPFKQAHLRASTDRELIKLTNYLRVIRKVKDISKLDHKKWEALMRKRLQGDDASNKDLRLIFFLSNKMGTQHSQVTHVASHLCASELIVLLERTGNLLLLLQPLLPCLFRTILVLLLLWLVPHCLDSLVVQVEAEHDPRVESLLRFEGRVNVAGLVGGHPLVSVVDFGLNCAISHSLGDDALHLLDTPTKAKHLGNVLEAHPAVGLANVPQSCSYHVVLEPDD